MKKKSIIVLSLIFILSVGYAAVNTVLDIKGNVNLSYNEYDFKLEITNLEINGVNKNVNISEDKDAFTFIGSASDEIKYTVTNYSYQYDTVVNLVCNPECNINQIGELTAQSKKTETITNTKEEEITCRIEVEKIGRTEYAEEMCPYKEGKTFEYSYTGSEQEFVVPCNGNYKFELWGASGGSVQDLGGAGAYTSGEMLLAAEGNLYIYVGEMGQDGSYFPNYDPRPSYNGGGSGSNSDYDLPYGSAHVSASGGGATDLRLKNGTWSNFDSLKSRIMVASGGGGKAFPTSVPGAGGTLLGSRSSDSSGAYGGVLGATGGTQTSGGITSIGTTSGNTNWRSGNDGYFGVGGNSIIYTHPGGGGGGGYYGGAAGGSGYTSMGGASGTGGSSFISGHNGCDAIASSSTESNIVHTGQPNHYSGYVFTETKMIDGEGYSWTNIKGSYTAMPSHDGTSFMTGNSGNGYAKITYLGNQ